MTGNAQETTPFEGAARSQKWVMRSLSPWIRRMASGPAPRASATPVSSSRHIGAQAAQQASWLSRRADRIQRAAAWNGELGTVSPALIDRFSQRVASRVQRRSRAHQVDSYAGGDNLDNQLDMPLATNDGQITQLSEGNSAETPFEFGAFSPEYARPAPPPEAPATPPIADSMRSRAEQLRRSLAQDAPAAPQINPASRAPAVQPSRAMPSLPAAQQSPAPRPSVMRARPATRIEELGPGKAPKPAPAMSPTPEPPRSQLQRSALPPQTHAPRPAPASPSVPGVQRAAAPQVVQGQGRLTQMLNARFRPKLDQARNPDAASAADEVATADDFDGSDIGAPPAAPPAISRSFAPLEGNDLPPRTPIQRAVAPQAGDTAGETPAAVPVPTPKPRVLRKPAGAKPVATSPATAEKSDAPAVQRQPVEHASDSPQPAQAQQAAPMAAPASPTQDISTAGATPVQRDAITAPAQPAPFVQSGGESSETPAIQRESLPIDAINADMPLVAPAQQATPDVDVPAQETVPGQAPAIQRAVQQGATSPSSTTPETIPPSAPQVTPPAVIQRSALAVRAPQRASDAAEPAPAQAPSDTADELPLRTPRSAPTVAEEASDEPAQRSAVDLPVAQPPALLSAQSDPTSQPVQRSAMDLPLAQLPATSPATSPAQNEAPAQPVQRSTASNTHAEMPLQAQPSETATVMERPAVIQRMALNAPAVEPTEAAAPDADADMPLVQRAPAAPETQAVEDGTSSKAASQQAITSLPANNNPAPDIARNASTPATPQTSAPARPGDVTAGKIGPSPIQREVAPSVPNAPNTTAAQGSDDLVLRAPAEKFEEAADKGATESTDAGSPTTDAPIQRAPAARTEPPATQRPASPRTAMPMQRDTPASAKTGVTPPAIQRGSDTAMVLRSPLERSAPADGGEAMSGQWNAVEPRQTRMAGVAKKDMPVLHAMTGLAGEGALQPESRALAMPIVQRAVVKHERQAADARPVNPFAVAQARAEAMPVVQRALVENEAPGGDGEISSEAKAQMDLEAQQKKSRRPLNEAELTHAAQRILPLIKRMLAVERERLFGR